MAPVAAESDALAEDLLDLSINDLLNVKVTGAAVRDLRLQHPAQTGNPFRWRAQQIAASVESIDHDTMQARGLNNVIEAAENLVGVLSGDSPAEPHSFSIRGFSRDSINVLHDGISVGIATLNTRPQGTYNLDRLEIVKGAATLQHG
ncbi:TonB-dependent receptor plug domain-containing protein [Silanimonas sp.]|uniref:TonB-dependent receptor plug domain-containing protein n=1 Tax=Silanimonas sp. TaxID=1929290 RepID=UPI0037CC9BEE